MLPLDFAIVDPHVHHWCPYTTWRENSALARPLRHWPELYLKLGRKVVPKTLRDFVGPLDHVLLPYLPPDRLRDAGALKVDTIVHMEAGWFGLGPFAPVGETRWLETLDFASTGVRLGAIVAHADLCSRRVDDVLSAHAAASARVRGIRHMGAHHPDRGVHAWCRRPHLFTEAKFLRGFERLAGRGLRFDAWVYSTQLPDVIALADRFPKVAIVLDHLGTPVAAAGPVAGAGASERERERIVGAWRDDLARLAECKNVSVKLSGLTMPVVGFGFHQRPEAPGVDELVDRLGPFVRHGLDVFGVERCFFASNFPMDKVGAPYERLFAAYTRLASERGRHAPRALLRDNALAFYGV